MLQAKRLKSVVPAPQMTSSVKFDNISHPSGGSPNFHLDKMSESDWSWSSQLQNSKCPLEKGDSSDRTDQLDVVSDPIKPGGSKMGNKSDLNLAPSSLYAH